jgi:hypothetical protein
MRAAKARLSSRCGSALLMWLQGCLNLRTHVDTWVETLISRAMIPVLFELHMVLAWAYFLITWWE